MTPSASHSNMDDPEIISLVLSGKTDCYEKIIRKYNRYLYKIGKSYGFNHNDIEDLMQETYYNVFVNLEKFENRSSFKTWIVRIMLNNCFHKMQKFKQRELIKNDMLSDNSVWGVSENNEQTRDEVQNEELKEILERAIHRIPENYRIVFTLRELNGMSVRETSDALNISEGNVKTRLSRSKALLQKEIKKAYSTEEIFELNLVYCDRITAKGMRGVE